jgi:GH25 family lysozyme M1 (1,4-beta-N-acetylmuramidase)
LTYAHGFHGNGGHFKNGRLYHGNRERMSKSLTSFISETAKGISTKLGIYIKEGNNNNNNNNNNNKKLCLGT